jgi:hypothetical protein
VIDQSKGAGIRSFIASSASGEMVLTGVGGLSNSEIYLMDGTG